MTHKKITIVDGDDWSGLYVNGQLEHEAHRFSAAEVLYVLGIEFEFKRLDDKWIEEVGCLPENISDVKFDQ